MGASQNVARSCTTLNAILADSLRYVAEEIEKGVAAGGKSHVEVAEDVLRATFLKHQDIIFEGNGYSAEWRAEVRLGGGVAYMCLPARSARYGRGAMF